MRVAEKIELDAVTERELRVLSRRRRVEARLQQRARVILLAAEGWQNKDIADEVALDRRQVALWRQRFLQGGIDALRQDAPRSGRTPSVTTAEMQSQISDVTLHYKPVAATHWSTRTLAEHWAWVRPPSAVSGTRHGSSRTWRAPSSSRATRASWTSCSTWSGCI